MQGAVAAYYPEMEELVGKFLPLAHSLANQIQWREDDHEDLVQTGMLGLFEGMARAKEKGTSFNCLEAFCASVLRRSMNEFYTWKDRKYEVTDVEDMAPMVTGEAQYYEEVMVSAFLDEVARLFGPRARRMVEYLMEPEGPVVDEVLKDYEVKSAERAAGRKVKGGAAVTFRRHHVQRALGMTYEDWAAEQARLREFASAYFGHSIN